MFVFLTDVKLTCPFARKAQIIVTHHQLNGISFAVICKTCSWCMVSRLLSISARDTSFIEVVCPQITFPCVDSASPTHTPHTLKCGVSRLQVQRIDLDSLVSGGCTSLYRSSTAPQRQPIAPPLPPETPIPVPALCPSDPLPITYHSPAPLWHEGHTRAAPAAQPAT